MQIEDNFDDLIQLVINVAPTTFSKSWIKTLPPDLIRKALSARSLFEIGIGELFDRLYKLDVDLLKLGDTRSIRTTGQKAIITAKFIYIVAKVCLAYGDKGYNPSDLDTYHVIAPIIKKSVLLTLLLQVTGWQSAEASTALELFMFDRLHKKLDIWCQPLIPVGEDSCILLPNVASTMDMRRFFEYHIAQWDIGFDDRGPVFEEDIRGRLRARGIAVSPSPIRFMASDGKTVEYDVVAVVDQHILLIEAKCLRSPYSPADSYSAWREIEKGINQVIRRKKILKSDWDSIRKLAGIDLPESPYEDEKILGIVITNIFSFTGFEVKGIRVADIMCLDRFLSSSVINQYELSRDKGITRELNPTVLWIGARPTAQAIWDYMKKPAAVSRVLDNLCLRYQHIPKLIETDPTVLFPIAQLNTNEKLIEGSTS
jgi:hypothetical protein